MPSYRSPLAHRVLWLGAMISDRIEEQAAREPDEEKIREIRKDVISASQAVEQFIKGPAAVLEWKILSGYLLDTRVRKQCNRPLLQAVALAFYRQIDGPECAATLAGVVRTIIDKRNAFDARLQLRADLIDSIAAGFLWSKGNPVWSPEALIRVSPHMTYLLLGPTPMSGHRYYGKGRVYPSQQKRMRRWKRDGDDATE